jgi:chromosome partitioning protein
MVISIASQKGGTGKTSTSSSKVLMPNYLELHKEETIYMTILERQPRSVRLTNIPNLEIVPSHILLSNTDIDLTRAKDHREARFK